MAALGVTFPNDRGTGDAAEHTQEHTREAEEQRQKARGLSSTKTQYTPFWAKLPAISPWHLAYPSHVPACFSFMIFCL